MPRPWFGHLVATLRLCWHWHAVPGRLCVRFRRPEDRYDHWEVWAYPRVLEVVGGKKDGSTVWSGFLVDVSQLLGELEAGQIGLSTAMGDVPPELVIEGTFRGRAVLLHLCLEPLADVSATEVLDVTRQGGGRIRKKR